MILAFGSWPVAACAALLVLFGSGLVAVFARRLRRIRGVRDWVKTPCEVRSILAAGSRRHYCWRRGGVVAAGGVYLAWVWATERASAG